MHISLTHANIYYEIHGEGTPLILLHGFGLDHRSIKAMMEPLFTQQTGWKRIYLDLPGMGLSRPYDSLQTADEMLETIQQFIQQVIPDQEFAIVAFSYGTYLTQGLLHKWADRIKGLLFISPIVKPIVADRNVPPETTLVHDPELLASLSPEEATSFIGKTVIQSPHIWERYRTEVLVVRETLDMKFLSTYRKNGYALSFKVEQLPTPYTLPTTIIIGRQDHLVGYKDMFVVLDMYPHASFHIIDHAGHYLYMEQEEIFTALAMMGLKRMYF